MPEFCSPGASQGGVGVVGGVVLKKVDLGQFDLRFSKIHNSFLLPPYEAGFSAKMLLLR